MRPTTPMLLLCQLATASAAAAAFEHPAGWHTASDIARVRSYIAGGKEPWKTAVAYLLNDTSLTVDFKPGPVSLVCRTCCSIACCPPGTSCHGASSVKRTRDSAPTCPRPHLMQLSDATVWCNTPLPVG